MNPAPRHIPVTPDDLTGWCGPVEWSAVPGVWRRGVWGYIGESSGNPVWGLATSGDGHDRGYAYRLDVTRWEVREFLLRRYALPSWHRDTPGGLTAEQSAAVVLGSVLRVRAGLGAIKAIVIPSLPSFGEPTSFWVSPPYSRLGGGALAKARRDDKKRGIVPGWSWGVLVGTYRVNGVANTGSEAQAAAERAVVNLDAVLATPTGILLPPLTPGGEPVLWSIE